MVDGEEKQRIGALYPVIDEKERRWSHGVRQMMRMTATQLRTLLQQQNIDSTGNLQTLQDRAVGHLTDYIASTVVLEPVTPAEDQHQESPLYYGKVHKTRMLATTVTTTSTTVTVTASTSILESNKENTIADSNLPTVTDITDEGKTPHKQQKKKPFKPRYSGHVERSASTITTPSRSLSTTTTSASRYLRTTASKASSSTSSVGGSVKMSRRSSSSLPDELITPLKRTRRALLTSSAVSTASTAIGSSARARSTNRHAAERMVMTRRHVLQSVNA